MSLLHDSRYVVKNTDNSGPQTNRNKGCLKQSHLTTLTSPMRREEYD